VSKMSKPTALHTEGTTKVSEWFNISDIAKKLYYSKSNSGIAVVITRPNCKQGLKAEVYFYQESKDKKERDKNTHIQVHRSGFRESARVKWSHDGTWLRQVGAERGPRLKSDNVERGCRLQHRGAVQERSGSRQHVVAHHRDGRKARCARDGIREHETFSGHEMRGPAGTGRSGVSTAGGRQGQGAGKREGVRGRRGPSPPCFLRIYLCISAFCLDEEDY